MNCCDKHPHCTCWDEQESKVVSRPKASANVRTVLAEQAMSLTVSMMQLAVLEGVIPSASDYHIVLLDPSVPYSGNVTVLYMTEVAVLAQRSVGNPLGWEDDYKKKALTMAHMVWRDGCVLRHLPVHARRDGDILEKGGTAMVEQTIVAVSGLGLIWSQMVATCVAAQYNALFAQYCENQGEQYLSSLQKG